MNKRFGKTAVLSLLIGWSTLLGLVSVGFSGKNGSEKPKKTNKSRIQKSVFGQTADGTTAHLFTLTNTHGMVVKITNFGGIITSIVVPDKNRKPGDVVLGFDSLSRYLSGQPYFGALIGRYSSFIAKGRFSIDGTAYQLATNAGPNHLHGGVKGFDKKRWKAEEIPSKKGVILQLTYRSPDGEEGYPGNLDCKVTFTLTEQNALHINYEARTDQKTPVNLTHHNYFDLSAGSAPTILHHKVMINADRYVVMDPKMVPTGELRNVKNTPLDFTEATAMGSRMEQLPGAYDHNYRLKPSKNALVSLAATAYDPTSGRFMEVFTNESGIELATANWLNGKLKGKENRVYGKQAGFLLYPQHLPDSPNQPSFPSTLLKPGEVYHQTTIYQFSTKPADSINLR